MWIVSKPGQVYVLNDTWDVVDIRPCEAESKTVDKNNNPWVAMSDGSILTWK